MSADDDERDWLWVPDTRWRAVAAPKRCRWGAGFHHGACGKPAVAEFRRSNGYWAYCANHLYGRRWHDGVIEINVHSGSPAAQRGYA